MAIKAFWKERGKLLFLLALAVAVIVYAAVELNGLPGVISMCFFRESSWRKPRAVNR